MDIAYLFPSNKKLKEVTCFGTLCISQRVDTKRADVFK